MNMVMILGMTSHATCVQKSFSGLLVCLPKSGTTSKMSLWGSLHDIAAKGRRNRLNAIVQASIIPCQFCCFVYWRKLFVIAFECKNGTKNWKKLVEKQININERQKHTLTQTNSSLTHRMRLITCIFFPFPAHPDAQTNYTLFKENRRSQVGERTNMWRMCQEVVAKYTDMIDLFFCFLCIKKNRQTILCWKKTDVCWSSGFLRQRSIHIDGRWSNCLENSTLQKNSEIFRRHCHVANCRLANLARFSSQIPSVAKAVRHAFFIAEIFDCSTTDVRSKKQTSNISWVASRPSWPTMASNAPSSDSKGTLVLDLSNKTSSDSRGTHLLDLEDLENQILFAVGEGGAMIY